MNDLILLVAEFVRFQSCRFSRSRERDPAPIRDLWDEELERRPAKSTRPYCQRAL